MTWTGAAFAAIILVCCLLVVSKLFEAKPRRPTMTLKGSAWWALWIVMAFSFVRKPAPALDRFGFPVALGLMALANGIELLRAVRNERRHATVASAPRQGSSPGQG